MSTLVKQLHLAAALIATAMVWTVAYADNDFHGE